MTQPTPVPARPKRGLSFLISAVALVLALVAVAISGAAFVRAGQDPTSEASASPSGAATPATTSTTTAPAPTETSSSPGDTPTAVNPTDLPSPGASYTLVDENVALTLTPLYEGRQLDLDQPLVNADQTRADARFSSRDDPPTLRFVSASVAIAKTPTATPDDCASAIQLAPSDPEVTLSQDLTICAVTNGLGAVEQPTRAKMARIVVGTVAKNGQTTITLTTWEIPR